MKKVLLALAVIGMIGFASCTKEKECKCTYTDANGQEQEYTSTIDEGTCADLEVEDPNTHITPSCEAI